MSAVSAKKIFFWNIMGSLSTAAISVVLLMVVTHTLSITDADLYSFAYALSNLMIMIGLFQVRNFQSTDMTKVYQFEDYLLTRLITGIAMLITVIAYLYIAHFESYKTSIVFYTCLYRLTDSVSDVYQGFYQQNERLDLAGKYLSIRNGLIFLVFSLVLYLTKDLLVGLQLVCIVSVVTLVMTEIRYSFAIEKWYLSKLFSRHRLSNAFLLMKQTLPLFINGFLLMYTYNKTKYVLDDLTSLGDIVAGEQTIFNILLMPAFVMNLLILFFRPLITELALHISKNEAKACHNVLKKLFLYLGLSSLFIMVGSSLLGLPALSLLYSIDVTSYLLPFILIMVGGIFSSFAAAFDNIIVAMRCQKLLIVPYLGAFVISQVLTYPLVARYHILGAAISFNLAMFVLVLLSYLVYRFLVKQAK